MIDPVVCAAGDAATNLLERSWFGAAAAAQEAECEMLLRVLEIAELDWRRARARLESLQQLQDALGEEIAKIV